MTRLPPPLPPPRAMRLVALFLVAGPGCDCTDARLRTDAGRDAAADGADADADGPAPDADADGADAGATSGRAPVALVGEPARVLVGRRVTLEGAGVDPDGDELSYAWTQTGGPAVVLAGADGPSPTFLARAAGTYAFTLVVHDGALGSEPASVQVFVHDAAGGGAHSLVLLPEGTLWAFGSNAAGQLGDGTSVDRRSPVRVCAPVAPDCEAEPMRDVLAVAAGGAHSLALRADGTVWAWGSNAAGQLGDGTFAARARPVAVCAAEAAGDPPDCGATPLADVVAIAAGAAHSVALRADGSVVAWGAGDAGELGDGVGSSESPLPIEVCALGGSAPCSRADGNALSLPLGAGLAAGSGGHTLALRAGAVIAWGANGAGQVGEGHLDGAPVVTPEWVCAVGELVGGGGPCGAYLEHVAAVAVGGAHSLAVDLFGDVFAWGRNSSGELGAETGALCAGGVSCAPVPTPVCRRAEAHCSVRLTDVASVAAGEAHSVALREDGRLRAWGANASGELGLGTRAPSARPATVCDVGDAAPCARALDRVVGVVAGAHHTLALLDDGGLVAFGANGAGQLGDGTTADGLVPVRVAAP